MRPIDADKLVQAFWKVLYDYEDKTEKQFMEHEELDLGDWFEHRIFVQNIHGELLNAIAEAPTITVDRPQEWIPCSERLPDEREWVGTAMFGTTISDEVLITFDVNGERFVKTLSLQNGELSNYEKRSMDAVYKGWKMLAWMPLPEPYEAKESE